MSEPKKCAHLSCTCLVTSEKYCSSDCERQADITDIKCSCGHLLCENGEALQEDLAGPSEPLLA